MLTNHYCNFGRRRPQDDDDDDGMAVTNKTKESENV